MQSLHYLLTYEVHDIDHMLRYLLSIYLSSISINYNGFETQSSLSQSILLLGTGQCMCLTPKMTRENLGYSETEWSPTNAKKTTRLRGRRRSERKVSVLIWS